MKNLLKKLCKENKLCEIYTNTSDPDSFDLAYIVAVDDENFIIENVSPEGGHDGLQCLEIGSIIRIKTDTVYSKHLLQLMQNKNFKRLNKEFKDESVLPEFLKYIKSNNFLCIIELNCDYSCNFIGTITSIDENLLAMNLVGGQYGEPDGTGYAAIKDVSSVEIHSDDLKKLEIYIANK